jgi:hypothetical protein
VLETALECLLHPGASDLGLRPAAAAVVVAIVEVQGPEFCPTSKTHPVAECALPLLASCRCHCAAVVVDLLKP